MTFRYFLHSHIVWTLGIVHVVFVAMLAFIERELYQEILTGVLFGVALGAITATAPEGWRTLARPSDPERFGGDLLVVALPILFIATAIGSGWSLYWRALGQPPGMLDASIWAYHRFLLIIAASLAMVSPGAYRGRLPPIELLKLAGWVGLGGFVFAMTVFYVVARVPPPLTTFR